MNNYKLYVPNEKQWNQACGTDCYNPRKPGCRIIKNAIMEPPIRELHSGASFLFRGGVCDENGKFVAGLKRHTTVEKMNLAVYDSYGIPDNIEHLSGSYIYGGVLIGVFGHVTTDCLVNLWWVIKNRDNHDKIIFLNEHKEKGVLPTFWKIAEILGIKERIMVVERACQVESIIVPDSSFIMYAEYTDEMLTVYKAIGSSVLEKPSEDRLYKKIYLTRTQFSKGDCYGENYFDEFYRKRGYEIIAPETLPFETQIRILNHAEEIVCSIGSMSHMLLFANNRKAKVTFLIRKNEIPACRQQIMMNQAIGIDYDIVDVSMNLLPTSHAGGMFLVGPTKYFIQYLDDNKIAYDEDEVQMDWSCLHDYFVAYTNRYNRDGYPFRRIKNLDMFDVINRMNFVFNGTHLNRNKMQTRSKLQLEKEINDLKNNQNGNAVMKFSYYFASTGWIDNIENLQPVVKSSPMEAIQIYNPYPDCKIECQIKQLQIGWQSGKVEANNSLLCGQIEKSLPMTAIRLKVAAGCDNYELLYRAYMKTTGWTRLCRNDEICGSISEECEDCIMGMQIILINHSMDRKKIDKI